jgi:hypothetical protein
MERIALNLLSRILVTRQVLSGFSVLMNLFIGHSPGGSTNTHNTEEVTGTVTRKVFNTSTLKCSTFSRIGLLLLGRTLQSIISSLLSSESYPCGSGVEYLHRDPASRTRRRKGKSRIRDSKIWPRVLRGSDPKMTALARASSNCKRQTCPLVREGAPNQQTRNCQTIIKIWS